MSPITIRPATIEDVQAISEVHIASWQHTYAGIFPQHYIDSFDIARRTKNWQSYLSNGHMMYVATDSGRVVGFTSVGQFRCEPTHLKGEISTLYLRPEYLRKGIGSMLFAAAKDWLLAQQLLPFGLWVAPETTARHFYRAMGGEESMERKETVDKFELTERLIIYTS